MQNFFFKLCFFVIMIGSCGVVYGENPTENFQAQSGKIYISSHEVAILNDQILIYSKQQWRPVAALYSDANGLYAKVGLWYCKACGWHNEDVFKCRRCGRPRPE